MFSYKVTVSGKGNDVNVTVRPQPVVTREAYTPVVTGTMQRILTATGVRNTMLSRAKLKKDLIEALKSFHDQDMIRPVDEKEKEEAT